MFQSYRNGNHLTPWCAHLTVPRGQSSTVSHPLLRVESVPVQIGDSGAEALGRMLARSSRLEVVELKHNLIRDNGMEQIASGLRQNRSPRALDE